MSKIWSTILQSYKHRLPLPVQYIPSVATVMIIAYNWQTNRNHRQQQQCLKQWFHTSSSSSSGGGSGLSSDWWRIRSAKLLSEIDIDYIRRQCLDSVCKCYAQSYSWLNPLDKWCHNGTGIRVADDQELIVVTNYHVVSGCSHILVHLYYQDYRQYPMTGRAAYVEPHNDMALIRFSEPVDYWQPIPLARKRSPIIGDPVLAMGTMQPKIAISTDGIVNADQVSLDMVDFHIEIGTIQTDTEGQPVIMHTAIILPGFSGGPLIDADGNVIAMNTMSGFFNHQYSRSADEILDFIERAKLYDNRVFPWQQTYREIKYSLAPAVKLGIVLSKEGDIFTVDDILPDSRCRELYDKFIMAINEQQLKTVRQLTDALNKLTGADDNQQIVTLIIMDGLDSIEMDSYQAGARFYTDLPVVF